MLPRTLLRSFLLVVAAVLPLASGFSQGSGPEAANQAAFQTFLTGDYEAAAAAYEKVLADYPTSAIVQPAQLQLAYSLYFIGKFAEAEAALNKLLTGPPPPPVINEAARSLLPQVISAKATAMEPDAAGRKAAFEDAVKKFSDFITQFPNSPELEAAVYGRALAKFQLEQYDEAIKDLEPNIQRFPDSPTIAQSRNLLALSFATLGSLELSKPDDADRAAAFANYDKATAILRQIIADRSDLTLVNEAQFQLGEILFNQAAFSDPEQRPALYDEALKAYRSVLSKDELLALQQQRLDAFPSLRAEALRANDRAAMTRLDEDNEREARRLGALLTKPDQTTAALLKTAEIFFNRNQPNATRVLLTHLEPFLETDDQKKRALYFKTMSYAVQNAATPAVESYDVFQAAHKGDPIAENLPLAIGSIFLTSPDPTVNNPERAAQYFEESLTIYPQGRFSGLSAVNRAAALSRLGQTDEALKTFQEFLAKNPRPEEGVVAQMGIADIYKNTGRWDEAIAAFQKVIDTYASQPQAVDATFWIAVSTQQKGDSAAAIPLLREFIEKSPENQLVPSALFTLATAQLATNDREGGMATLAEIAEKYPDSQPATFTYFQRAKLLGEADRKDEMLALMREFIEKYPQDDKVFFAFDSIAKTSLNDGNRPAAITAYADFVTDYPQNPQAPTALLQVIELQRYEAEALGRYAAMPVEDQAKWKENVDASIASAERLARDYPDSPQTAAALRALLAAQRLLVSAELTTPGDVETYFQNVAESSTPALRSKALFALASYLSESDPARALETMDSAYDPAVVYAPVDIDTYGTALLTNEKYDEALIIFEKLAADYPNPADPATASPEIQEAQAIVLFGKGRAAQLQGDTTTAGQFFEQLKTLYPWSPKVLEANYGIAQANFEQQKHDEALALLPQIIRATTATADLRANSMLLGGDIMSAKGDPEAAIDYYIKIAQFYSGVPKAAAEGLWKGGQLLEKQAAALTEPAQKQRQSEMAVRSYQDIVNNYPNSEYAPQAQARLAALGK